MIEQKEGAGTTGANPGEAAQLTMESVNKAHDGFVGLMDKFVTAKPEEFKAEDRESLVKTFGEYKDVRTKFTEAEAKAKAAADEAAKNVKLPDYKTLEMPKDTKLKATHLDEVRALAEKAKWPLETAKAVLERDSEVVSNHLKGVEAEFKKYGEEAVGKLKTEWGQDFEKKVAQNTKVVEFLEKQIPGTKAEIERMGLSNSYTTNKVFNKLFEWLHMDTDKFEFGEGTQPAPDASKRTMGESLNALHPKTMAHLQGK